MNNPKAQFNIPTDSGRVPRKGSPAGDELGPAKDTSVGPTPTSSDKPFAEFEFPMNGNPRKSD